MHPVALIILDGWGLASPGPANAVELAHTPNYDRILRENPWTRLEASGRAVGLPAGQMGNSEVGHLNLGAGRLVQQSLTYLDSQIETGEFFLNPLLLELMKGRVHLMGLVSRGGVHSQLDHVLALIEMARRQGVTELFTHVFTDGRDTPPDSALAYVTELEAHTRITTVCGRYYAMDRDHRWERVEEAYRAVADGVAPYTAPTAVEAVRQAYARGETDEFIRATVVGEPNPMRDGDAVFFFNFRADRGRQLSRALTAGPEFDSFPRVRRDLRFGTMMEYEAGTGWRYAFELPALERGLSQVVSAAGVPQFHAAETEKYPHVTFFFNLQREAPYPGEERLLVPSPKVATYDLQPEMSAPELARRVVERLEAYDDGFVLVNFANPDMVGHTGVLPAAVRACEAADEGLGRILAALERKGGAALVVADHGNAEVMTTEDGSPHTAHTTNLVPCVAVGLPVRRELRAGGSLSDVAPTVLELMGLPQPPEMTGRSLLL